MRESCLALVSWGWLLGSLALAQTVGQPPIPDMRNTSAPAPAAYPPAYAAPQVTGPPYGSAPTAPAYPMPNPAPPSPALPAVNPAGGATPPYPGPGVASPPAVGVPAVGVPAVGMPAAGANTQPPASRVEAAPAPVQKMSESSTASTADRKSVV